ncbi:carboxypeptidase-like regulatory domain-containing protein [Jiulongibacter sediminis]|uniref:carboxypeptidase-like regulatory domain-containing protein n=1 Tax=Jiulongibacter sediminis TaxID=1605367 RepID=UPI00103A1C42|nr:carboxypeptidase-like regulatory domain-containing protein [Jiulongibacter sediminis]
MSKRNVLLITLLLLCNWAVAQKQWSVFGKVVNQENGKPISSLTVTNQRTSHVVVTNAEGDFYIRAAEGDSLIITGIGYGRQAVYWDKSIEDLVVGIEQTAIGLAEVVVKDKRTETIEREIKEFLENPHNSATMKRDIMGNLVQLSGSGGLGGGAGISIDALYDLWSKEGKNRRKAAELEYQDLKRFYITLRYNKGKVATITKLTEPDLTEFMNYCKLDDGFILEASDYDLTYQILMCLREYNNTASFPGVRRN